MSILRRSDDDGDGDAMSKSHFLAVEMRAARDEAFARAYLPTMGVESGRVFMRCAVLLSVVANLIDDPPAKANNGMLYRREGRAFVKVKP